jgi:hypothetical protein
MKQSDSDGLRYGQSFVDNYVRVETVCDLLKINCISKEKPNQDRKHLWHGGRVKAVMEQLKQPTKRDSASSLFRKIKTKMAVRGQGICLIETGNMVMQSDQQGKLVGYISD